MDRKCLYFLKILRVELEDLLEDLKDLEERYRHKFASSEITNYVLLENEALLSREEEAVRSMIISIDGINLSRYKSLNEIVEALEVIARGFIKEREFPAAVLRLLRRKMVKVLSYVEAEEAP
ncbi:MAG TPA: hypothetical protein VLH39_05115 [Magnetospirillaceae bacterium]|nr:hypothetical protein [Magnetospirillaceae bacterium]